MAIRWVFWLAVALVCGHPLRAEEEPPAGVRTVFERIGAYAAFTGDSIQDPAWVLEKLKGDGDPVGAYIRTRLALPEQQLTTMLERFATTGNTKHAVAEWLTAVSHDPDLFEPGRFRAVRLSPETERLLQEQGHGSSTPSNAALLQDWLGTAYRNSPGAPTRVGEETFPFGSVTVYRLQGYEVGWDRDAELVSRVTCPFSVVGSKELVPEALGRRVATVAGWLGEDLDDWPVRSQEVLDHGAAGKEYTWSFRRVGPGDVELPSLLEIALRPNGDLWHLLRVVRATTVGLEPRIPQSEAVRAVQEKSPDWQLRKSALRVAFDPSGQQVLVWALSGADGGGDRYVEVDAHRGTIVRSVTPSGSSDDGAPDAAAVSAPRGPVSTTTKLGLLGLAALLAAALWWGRAASRRRPGISGPEAGS